MPKHNRQPDPPARNSAGTPTSQWLPSEDQMFAAIEARDAQFDGVFWTGVVTTGIVCLPSCSARMPKRENIRLFFTLEDAEGSGLRPCKRCRPQMLDLERSALIELARFVGEHSGEQHTLVQLAKRVTEVPMTPARLEKRFSGWFGLSLAELQDHHRMRGFKAALREGQPVLDALLAAGFSSTSQIYGNRYRSLGMPPASYRAGGDGESIVYADQDTSYGKLLLAATQRGVCFAQFGDTRQVLIAELRREFPRADIQQAAPDEHALGQWINALTRHLDQRAPRPDLPIDLRGTAFQVRTWRFLAKLAPGQTVSYSDVAKGIGEPKAVRAAASACAANRVAVLIPCHRVLRADGGLGGYRWGVERKARLLSSEDSTPT